MEETTDETIDEATDGTDVAIEATSDVAGLKRPLTSEVEVGSGVAVVDASLVVGWADTIVDVALSTYQYGLNLSCSLELT
jgi:hypothetical protein